MKEGRGFKLFEKIVPYLPQLVLKFQGTKYLLKYRHLLIRSKLLLSIIRIIIVEVTRE
jgi:hypothetical protein